MFDTNLFGETDPTHGNALGSCVNSMVIWEAEEMCTVPAHKANNLTKGIQQALLQFDLNSCSFLKVYK